MTDSAAQSVEQAAATQAIIVDEVFPHAPAVIWKTLTTGELIGRWLMQPTGFAAIKGTRFTYHTKAAGAWDGVIHCQVLEVVAQERLVYSWQGGHEGNVGYGAPLETIVTWTLTKVADGTRLRLVHAGFRLPADASAYQTMSGGWVKVFRNIDAVSGDGS
jgi:uncharacterized protein YndB with AHSA1/START domain